MKTKRELEPTSRLTRIADRMITALEMDEEYQQGDRAIFMLMNEDDGGIGLAGYDRPAEDSMAIADLLTHLRAVMEANGKRLDVGFVGEQGVDWA